MSNKNYNPDVIRDRLYSIGCRLDDKIILVSKQRLGIKAWGWVDFLCNYCGCHWRHEG